MKSRLTPAGVAAIALSLLTATGCGTTTSPILNAASDEVGLVRQLLGMNPEEDATFRQSYIDSCMAEVGFEYELEPFLSPPDIFSMSREELQEFGFGDVVGSASNVVEVSPNDSHLIDLTVAGREEWYDSYNRCADAANGEVDRRLAEVAEKIGPQLVQELAAVQYGAHPDQIIAIDAWAKCMKDSGWEFETPEEMIASLNQEFETISAGSAEGRAGFEREERTVALAYYECRTAVLEPVVEELVESLQLKVASVVEVTSLYEVS